MSEITHLYYAKLKLDFICPKITLFVCIHILFFVFPFQLEAEVKRLEKLKLQNICNVTAAVREEIASYWVKCFFSADQRQAFLPYYEGKRAVLIGAVSCVLHDCDQLIVFGPPRLSIAYSYSEEDI